MGSILIFVDETYIENPPAELLAVAAVAVFESNWSLQVADLLNIASVRRSRKLQAVRDFVGQGRLRAVIAGARLDELGARPGLRDTFSDTGLMSRRDNVWIQLMGYATNLLLRRVLENGWLVSAAALHYDSKSLAKSHRETAHATLIRVVERESRRLTKRMTGLRREVIRVRHVGPVPKPAQQAASSNLQWGTWLAHWVAKLPHRYVATSLPSNVEVYDLAPLAKQILQRAGVIPTP